MFKHQSRTAALLFAAAAALAAGAGVDALGDALGDQQHTVDVLGLAGQVAGRLQHVGDAPLLDLFLGALDPAEQSLDPAGQFGRRNLQLVGEL